MRRGREEHACSVPAMRVRLRGKQPEKPPILNGARRRRQTELQDAVRAGRVPKARRAFALFTQNCCAGVRPGAEHMKTVAARWRALPDCQKQLWKQAAAKELRAQIQAAVALGVRIRGRPCQPVLALPTPRPDAVGVACPIRIQYGQFRIENCEAIGQGSYGKVVRARHLASLQIVALKLGSEAGGADIAKELEVYTVLRERCPALGPFLQLLDGSCDPPCPWMALPFVESGSLRAHIAGKSSINAEAVALQLGWGLWHLHECGILHLDVKPGNLLWNPVLERLVIVDFGCSERFNPGLGYVTALSNPECEELVTPWYRAPELWLDRAVPLPPRLLRPAIDVWSYGCVLFEVTVGRPMFDSGSSRRAWCVWHREGGHQRRQIAAMIDDVPEQWWPVIWHSCHPTAAKRPKFGNDVVSLIAKLRSSAQPKPNPIQVRA